MIKISTGAIEIFPKNSWKIKMTNESILFLTLPQFWQRLPLPHPRQNTWPQGTRLTREPARIMMSQSLSVKYIKLN